MHYKMWLKLSCISALLSLVWWHTQLSCVLLATIVFAVYLACGGWRFAIVVVKTLPRDARMMAVFLWLRYLVRRDAQLGHSIPFLFERTAKRTPTKLALQQVDGRAWTFHEVSTYAQSVAAVFSARGYQCDDVVVLLMESRPEYICVWLGLARLGVKVALVNHNLRGDALMHCIRVSKCRAIIYGVELVDAIEDVRPQFGADVELFYEGDSAQVSQDADDDCLDLLLRNCTQPPPPHRSVTAKDVMLYIYTSGTTGLPKAACITHSRFNYTTNAIYMCLPLRCDDVVYCCLPLYHMSAGVLGTGLTLLRGCTLVIRRKFSASRFWADCRAYDCTAVQYIGEICRYLLAQPASADDRRHTVRVAVGNGLRLEIWRAFVARFNVPQIAEFYGATEGNANFVNSCNKVGAVGFNSRILPGFYPVALIKVDEVTRRPLRQKNGLCIVCEPGEPGELVGRIDKGDPIRHFTGYVDDTETDNKIASNVFSKGDKAFLSGDILVMDELGFLYFKDRTGNTYRWRGENVSTQQVEAVISNLTGLRDAIVYGVTVPNNEGCAGMAAIVDPDCDLDLSELYKDLQKALPSFAIPVFLRLLAEVEMTGTFKMKNTEHRKEGFDPHTINDRLYYRDTKLKQYSPIDAQVYNNICSGNIRL